MTAPVANAPGPPEPPPAGGRAVRWWWVLVAPVLAVLAMAGAGFALIASTQDDGGRGAHEMGVAPPLDLASVSEDVAAHYRFAATHQADLSVIPCFCGCEEFLAHESLYDCFIRRDGAGYDSHGAGCGICVGEAAVATQLLRAGTPASEVADRIIEQFGTTPITSPDQTIPRR